MNKVMSNASPIISLSTIGLIHLLKELFDEVLIPAGVYQEIVEGVSVRYHGKKELEQSVDRGDIQVYNVENHKLVNQLYGKLHKGELEVIIGAKELNIEYVLIDEKTARHLAEDFLLTSIGTIGLLLIAKKQEKIPEIKKYLDQLITNHFYMSKSLYKRVLIDAEEWGV